MEPSEQGLLEDLLAPRGENWTTFPSGEISGFFPGWWNYESFDEIDTAELTSYSNPSFLELITSSVVQPTFHCPCNGNYPLDNFSAPVPIQEEWPSLSMAKDGDQVGELGNKVEPEQVTTSDDIPSVFSMGLSGVRKSKSKKVEGQPSKNLMAERRRRKRLNDRLSMLRSIVPKISKMDRTSILGDTIDYMKELLEKIHILKEEGIRTGMETDQLNMGGSFKELNMNEVQVRNPPKFNVERQNTDDTRIEVFCSSKSGLLLNTVSTVEALGLDIEQCIISCFNDFSLQASCSEGAEHRRMMSSEEVKQVLFRNAGYGGRCP